MLKPEVCKPATKISFTLTREAFCSLAPIRIVRSVHDLLHGDHDERRVAGAAAVDDEVAGLRVPDHLVDRAVGLDLCGRAENLFGRRRAALLTEVVDRDGHDLLLRVLEDLRRLGIGEGEEVLSVALLLGRAELLPDLLGGHAELYAAVLPIERLLDLRDRRRRDTLPLRRALL